MATAPPAAPAAPPLAVDVRGVSVGYGNAVVLSRLNLAVRAGGLVALVGPPAAGKSTFLGCLLGRLAPRAGELRVLGQTPERARSRVGYVPQSQLVDWSFPLTVEEVVAMGWYRRLGLLGRIGARERDAARQCLAELGIEHLVKCRVEELSPGERQLALVARGLVQRPELLLLDEPLSGLDEAGELELFGLFDRSREAGRTVLVATGALEGLRTRFDELVLLNGRVVARGAPDEVLTEANLEATFGRRGVLARVPAGHFAVDRGAARG